MIWIVSQLSKAAATCGHSINPGSMVIFNGTIPIFLFFILPLCTHIFYIFVHTISIHFLHYIHSISTHNLKMYLYDAPFGSPTTQNPSEMYNASLFGYIRNMPTNMKGMSMNQDEVGVSNMISEKSSPRHNRANSRGSNATRSNPRSKKCPLGAMGH